MQSPFISVIVPVYNPGEYLRRCVKSILNQTESNLELILVDDGSTDGSGALCDAFAGQDARVRVIHKANAGVSAARNDGIRAARGEFVAFADGDDWPEPEMYGRLLAEQRQSGCDVVYCGFRRVFENRTEEETFPATRLYADGGVRDLAEGLFRGELFGAVWRGLYARKTVTGTEFDPGIHYAEDLLFNLEILRKAGSVAVIPEVLYNYNKANENSVCARTEHDPDFRYTASLQRQLEINEFWGFSLDPEEFYKVYVDMMYHYLVLKLREGGNEALVEQYLSEGFFAGCCHHIRKIPMRRRIICMLIRARRFRLAVAVRNAEDLVLKLLGR